MLLLGPEHAFQAVYCETERPIPVDLLPAAIDLFGSSVKSSDFIVDTLSAWWTGLSTQEQTATAGVQIKLATSRRGTVMCRTPSR
jgi:hypothetical protein